MRWLARSLAYATAALAMVMVSACVAGDRPSADRIACSGGTCTCTAGFGNCDGEAQNGCEAVLSVDPKNCGACGTSCVNGSCDAGTCACNDGFFDCNGDPEDGCEALLRVDPDNCGECGHSCLGGECNSSTCSPFLFAELGTYVYALTANEGNVFYCDGDSGVLYRVSKTTGESTQLVFDQNCFEMAASENSLFWSVRENGDELIRVVPADGGTARTIAVADSIDAFAAAGDTVLWVEYDAIGLQYELFTASSLGEKVAIAQSMENIRNIEVSGSRVFWIDGSTGADTNMIRTAPLTGGAAATLVTRDMIGVERILVVDDMVYWLETDSEGETPTIFRVRSTGGPEEELYVRNREVGDLLGDETGLYWTEDQGDRWMRGPLDGGDVEVLAEFQDITLPVSSPSALFWIDFPSHLFALAK